MHSLNTIKQQNKSNAKKLIDLTIKNGGVSFNSNLEELNYKEGFAVGIYNRINLVTINRKELEIQLNKISKDIEFRLDRVDEFFGLWVNNGIFYLDRTFLEHNYNKAVYLGQFNKQKAIYDFKNKIEINLEGGK
jgi:hypothetical protein